MKLDIEHLNKCYGKKTALQDFSYSFTEGIYGLLGANGAGKSTLMNLLTDNTKRDGGSICLDGKDILRMGRQYRALIGYMPQQQGLYEQFSGRTFLQYMRQLKGLSRQRAERQIPSLLQLVHLEDAADAKIGSYSGGMKQRILLAQALLGNPRILILDEPSAGLDPKERIHIRSYIHELGKNRIVLLATHIVSDVESIADDILLMKDGKLVQSGSPETLLESIQGKMQTVVPGHVSLEDVYLYYMGQSGLVR